MQSFALVVVVLMVLLSVHVSGRCDNACSGHGTCGEHGVCSCYDNWGMGQSHDSGDCSDRICPFEFAWVDTPDKVGRHHKYAECANRGICDRTTGECACFPGYEGRACQRTTCPNLCSGHGTCAYIEDMPFQAVPADAIVPSQHAANFLEQSAKTYHDNYVSWDVTKTRGCICDPEYGDVDCSKRMCMYGTDVMDQRDNMLATQKYQTQNIWFQTNQPMERMGIEAQTFALTFKSRLNETFTTIPIAMATKAAEFSTFLTNVAKALESLPNRVIDKVMVQGATDTTGTNGYQGSSSGDSVYLNITFTGDLVQGPQHLLTVKSFLCGDGCTPKLSGLELLPNSQNITEIQLADFNSYECGRRGKCDYTTGQCTCFSGYTGINCNTITSLV